MMKELSFSASSEQIHFKSVRKFETYGSDLKSLDTANIAITFDQLDDLAIYGETTSSERVFRFINKHPTISKLTYFNNKMDEETTVQSAEDFHQ